MGKEGLVKVLIVDDEKTVRDFLVRYLKMQNTAVKAVEDGFQAIEATKEELFDIVFLDVRMPRMNGLQTYAELKKIYPNLPHCVFMTGYAIEANLIDITKQSGALCLKKPFEDLRQIKEIIDSIVQEKQSNTSLSESKPSDRRAFIRLDAGLQIEYKLKDSLGESQTTISENVSLFGLKLILPEEFTPGALLDLTIKNIQTKESCNVLAKIVWSRKAEKNSGLYDTGINLLDADSAILSKFIVDLKNSQLE